MIQDRVSAGLERAKAQGKRLGHPSVYAAVEQAMSRERAKGTGISQTVSIVGIGVGTVQRVVNGG